MSERPTDRQLVNHKSFAAEELGADLTYIALSADRRNALLNAGCKYVHISYWASNLDCSSLEVIKSYVEWNSEFHVEFCLCTLPPCEIRRLSIAPYYKSHHALRGYAETAYLEGNFLEILVGGSGTYEVSALHNEGQRIARECQLYMGLSSAFRLGFEYTVDLDTNERHHQTPEPYLVGITSIYDGQDRSAPGNFLEEPFLIPDLSEDMAYIVDAVLNGRTSTERFLFSWFGVETLIGSSGNERKRFCLEDLSSNDVNKEMTRLRDLRVASVHHGQRQIEVCDLQSVLWLLRICLLPAGRLREKVVDHYVEWLRSGMVPY